jgi:hypothetical protein
MKARVTQLINSNNKPVANHFVIREGNTEYLKSYKSIVAKLEGNTVTLGRDWDYSSTTLRHLKYYLGINDSVKMIRKDLEEGLYKYDSNL